MLAVSALAVIAPKAHAELGDAVVNVATVSYDQPGTGRIQQSTNEAVFIIEARRTPSTIEFFRHAPAVGAAVTVPINGSDFSPSGSATDFVPVGPPETANGVVLDFSGPVPLAPAQSYLSGELIVLRVIDEGQNGNPNVVETVIATVTTDKGDEITLRLYESGPDTGHFYAYVPSSPDSTPQNDVTLTAPSNTTLTATYIDAFDATEISVDTALVDPFCRVFDSLTGRLIDNAVVTIMDTSTGQPAVVFGVDGVSTFPSTIQSGETTTDSSGLQYPSEDGEFVFPLLLPGDYRIEVVPPGQYVFPSVVPEDRFNNLDNAPFVIEGGSFALDFTLTEIGTPSFDVPLDPEGELVLTKETVFDKAAAGDAVGYTVSIENRDAVPLPINVMDELPAGFRYVPGSARLDGVPIEDPTIGANGRQLTFFGGLVESASTAELTYVTNVTAGVPLGTAVNSVVAVNRSGEPISNRAEATVFIRDDLLRSRLTIIGRVAEAACEEDDEWARELQDGEGVEDVRLYMEDGEYVVTDENGLFHFEDVSPGTHVVQIDTETLPKGYEPMICEENSRYAHSAISKFVDAQGGSIWRANFYLKRTEDFEEEVETAQFDDRTEYLEFQEDWLEEQNSDVAWIYPQPERTPSTRSVNVGIKHSVNQSVRLKLNGSKVPGLNYSGRDLATNKITAISRWRGLDILAGRNEFVAEIVDSNGNIEKTLTKEIWFNADVERVRLVDDQSILVADGRTAPSIALRVENSAGRAVHAGRVVSIDLEGDYRLLTDEVFEDQAAVTARISEREGVAVGPDGIAFVKLEPTLKTGRVRLSVKLDDGRIEEIDTYLQPEKRDWIVVGLADATLGLADTDGGIGNDLGIDTGADALNDGRVAFFAKGVIKGDYLLTVAVDTAKRRGNRDSELFTDIDPNAYYTLYGDRSYQDSEAESRYPFYVKLEKNTFFALFGDYNTDLNETQLGRYSRRLSGLKTVYEGEKYSVTAFAAQTNQGFQREEIAADGTSGPYQLSNREITRNSELIVVETRDRFRPDVVVERQSMTRYADYEIDYDLGTVIFRHPVNASDDAFNPQIIVFEYETSADTERNITAGGRAAARFADGRIEVGGTYIREEGSTSVANAKSNLFGVDATVQVDEDTEFRAEYARSNSEDDGGGEDRDGYAYLVEVYRRKENYSAGAYVREDGEGFGLGQQGSGTQSVRRAGATANVRVSESVSEKTNLRTERFVDAQVYHEENLDTDQTRQVAEVNLRQENPLLGVSVGLRAVEEDLGEDLTRQSILATGSIRKTFPEKGLTISLAHEQPFGGKDESSLFPQRTIIGADKTLTDWATLNVRHERQNGANASGDTTVVGVSVQPWTGSEVRVASDAITQDSGRRIGATVGVDQTVQFDEYWTSSFGVTHRREIDGDDNTVDPVADGVRSPIEIASSAPLTFEENYTSAYVGLGYRSDKTAGSARAEIRGGEETTRIAGIVGAAREASEELSFAATTRVQNEVNKLAELANTERFTFDARLGAAYRPRGEGVVIFDRFDVSGERISGDANTWRVVNNLGVNFMVTDRTQISLNHGIKYSKTEINDINLGGVTQLFGGEIRHDISKRWDLGLHGSALVDHQTGTVDYSFGPSVGVTPAKNLWVSAGYNLTGFVDRDFEAAEFTQNGVFLKFRFKFDQTTADGLLKRISPQRDAVN